MSAHFHVIHMASAFVSSSVTSWWYRIPPLEGPPTPARAVDHYVDPAPVVRGDQLFVDRGVDSRVLSTDPGPGQEAACEIPGRVGWRRR